jgi:hypothetical protein
VKYKPKAKKVHSGVPLPIPLAGHSIIEVGKYGQYLFGGYTRSDKPEHVASTILISQCGFTNYYCRNSKHRHLLLGGRMEIGR